MRVAWHPERNHLSLAWREAGGPVVVEPTHRGFGSTLINESIPYELGGSVVLDFRPGRVQCTITIPLVQPRVGA